MKMQIQTFQMLKDIYSRKNMKYSDEKGEEDKKKTSDPIEKTE